MAMGRSYGHVWFTPHGQKFMNWVDDDLAGFAASAQSSRNGSMKTIDVSAGHDLGKRATRQHAKPPRC